MMEDKSDDKTKEAPPTNEAMESRQKEQPELEAKSGGGGGGGWGGWGGFSPFTVLSDLQKAAEEISRNAAEAAEKAAKSIADINLAEDSESSKGEEDDRAEGASDKETDDESAELRKSALDKLGNAGEDSILGQGLKVLDHSVENFATGAWQALGNAWKGGSGFVQRLETSAVDLAETIQKDGIQGAAGSVAPLLESGKAFTTKGIQVLEYVGKETMDLLIAESGMDVDKNSKSSEKEGDEDQLLEDVTFDRCFYIYGGPEQLEELESLANHYALLFNRRKVKLSSEQKSAYDGKLKMVQQIFDLDIEMDGIGAESNKGKNVEAETKGGSDEIKSLHDASVGKAADMAAGFTNALAGQTVNDMVQRTSGRLETLHSEGIHRLSEMACAAVSQLLMLGKSIISHANKTKEDADDIIWPEEIVERAKLIRKQTQTMARYTEAVSKSFVTGISDVAEAYLAAVKGATTAEDRPKKSIQEKADTFTELLQTGQTAAVGKIQDGLQYLTYVVISTSMPAA
ncbi:hypothetical protein LINGRAHAP2_LOCUS36093 [Linum grandiflorum]